MKNFFRELAEDVRNLMNLFYEISSALSLFVFLSILVFQTNSFILENLETVNYSFIIAISCVFLGSTLNFTRVYLDTRDHAKKYDSLEKIMQELLMLKKQLSTEYELRYYKICVILNKISLVFYLLAIVKCLPFLYDLIFPNEVCAYVGYADKFEPLHSRHFSFSGVIFMGLTMLSIINCLDFEIRFWWKKLKPLKPAIITLSI